MRKVPGWNEYFMNIAESVSLRSKDPNTRVGSVLVDENKHIIGTGYNGFPPGYPESEELWQKPQKYTIVIHSEVNAIIHSVKSPKNCTIFTTLYPCKECCKVIAAAGIKNIIYKDDRYKTLEAELFLKNSGISIKQYLE